MSSEHCVFCSIIRDEIPSEKVYEDEYFIAIRDVTPVAPQHVLLIPKKHCKNILEADDEIVGDMMKKISLVVEKMGIKDKGFRIVVNTGEDGGQTVDHLHFHILGGRELSWPPG